MNDPRPIPVPQAHVNPIRTRADWERQRAAALADPGAFHGAIAKRRIHWFMPAHDAWLAFDDASGQWKGWNAKSAAPVSLDLGANYLPRGERWFRPLDPPAR